MQGFLDSTRETQPYSQVACLVADLCHLQCDLVHAPRFLGQDTGKPR